jgi:putative flippase GtrA
MADARALTGRFDRVREALWSRLPFGLHRWIAPTAVGFAMIGLVTFSIDLALLAALYRGVGLPNPVAVTIGYAVAFCLAYLLNRWLNFHSHAPVGKETARYVVAVLLNYLLIILGIGSGLHYLGLPYQGSRVLAGLTEAVFLYAAMRWWVFRDRPHPAAPVPVDHPSASRMVGSDH